MLRGSRPFFAFSLTLTLLSVALLSWKGFPAFIAGHSSLKEALELMPYILLGVLAFLGLRMHQSRILFTAALLMLVFTLLAVPGSLPGLWGKQLGASRPFFIAVAIPLSFLILTFLKQGKLWSRFGAFFLCATLTPLLVEWALTKWAPGFTRKYVLGQAIHWPRAWNWRIPDFAFLLAIGFGLSSFTLKDRYFRHFQYATLFSLVPFFLLLNRATIGTGDAALAFSGIGWILLYGMYHLYWSKVYIDELTGIPNRRALDERLSQLDKNYWIAMCDIDFFKKFNDRFGHEEGDNVLRFVAAHLDLETFSHAYRYGGEEFCIVFEDLPADEALKIFDSARKNLAAKDFFIREPQRKQKSAKDRKATSEAKMQTVKVTLSIGAATQSSRNTTPDLVIQAADRLLYRAKDGGRNQVVAEA